MDEHLRRLERAAQIGGPLEREQFRVAYERAYGEGSFWRWRSQQEAERKRQQQIVIVDAAEQLITSLGDAPPNDDFWSKLSDTLLPLFEDGSLDWYQGWAGGSGSGNPDVRIYTANWNPEQMARLHDLLEDLPGVETDWSDQVSRCDGCMRAIQTEPDSYSWTPAFFIGDGFITCRDCCQENPDEVLAEYRNDPNRALPPALGINLEEHGWVNIRDDLESGWHPGQDANPQNIGQQLTGLGLDYIFAIESTGQFDTQWGVWTPEEELVAWLDAALEDAGLEEESSVETATQCVLYLLEHPEEIGAWPENLPDILSEGDTQDDD